MEKVNYHPFGYPLVVFQAAINRDVEAHNLFEKVMSLSTLIIAGKGQIIKTKRFLNEAVVARKHYKLLCAYNLPNPIEEPSVYLTSLRKAIKEYTEELHTHQKDLRKIYAVHNKTVEELKNAIDKFARTCAIRHNNPATTARDVGDIKGLPQIKEEQSLTTLNLSRIGVLTLIKKLSDEIKAKPTCNNFTITINTGVTKG
jgi:hypothetical protein